MRASTQTFFEKNFFELFFVVFYTLVLLQIQQRWWVDKGKIYILNLTKYIIYSSVKVYFFSANSKSLCKNYINNSYTFSFLTGIIYLFNMVLINRNEVIQQYFKSGLFYNNTAWKVFSGPYFSAFRLNMERIISYEVSIRIQSEYEKIRTTKNSVFLNTFHEV